MEEISFEEFSKRTIMTIWGMYKMLPREVEEEHELNELIGLVSDISAKTIAHYHNEIMKDKK